MAGLEGRGSSEAGKPGGNDCGLATAVTAEPSQGRRLPVAHWRAWPWQRWWEWGR